MLRFQNLGGAKVLLCYELQHSILLHIPLFTKTTLFPQLLYYYKKKKKLLFYFKILNNMKLFICVIKLGKVLCKKLLLRLQVEENYLSQLRPYSGENLS